MACPLDTLKKAVGSDEAIKALVANAFTTRNLVHFAHWDAKLYGTHMALGDLYDDIVEDIDEIVEVYQGKFGLLKNLSCVSGAMPGDITAHVKKEASWVESQRGTISRGNAALESLVDVLMSHYHRTVYKLENLK
jgi:hypothetical protein